MLLIIALILLVLWGIGAIASVGGGLIHALLVVALIIFIVDRVGARRSL